MRTEAVGELTELALARGLFHAGDYADALASVDVVLGDPHTDSGARLAALLLKASIFSETDRLDDSLEVLKLAGPLVDEAPAALRAKFFGQRAYVGVRLGHVDGPLVDYEDARFWAQKAGDKFSEASIRNNLAKRYSEAGRLEDALKESDAAISMIEDCDQGVFVGRFYDQRAQILNDHGRFNDALKFSEQAVGLLAGHPAFVEANGTHVRALIGIGTAYLNRVDPVTKFTTSKAICRSLEVPLNAEVIQTALERCEGNVYRAAALLNIKHPSLLESIRRHGLQDLQRRRHLKSVLTK